MPKSFVIYLRFSMYNALSISEHIELYIRLNFKSSDFHYFFKLFRFFSTFYFKSSLPLGSEARNCPFYKHYILYIGLFKAKSFYKTDFILLRSYKMRKFGYLLVKRARRWYNTSVEVFRETLRDYSPREFLG